MINNTHIFYSNQLISTSLPNSLHSPSHSILLEVDKYGVVLRSLHDQSGDSIKALSQATELSDGRVALGSYEDNRIVIINHNDVQ